MFCSWKRLSQRVYNIQIRMYFANLYVSLLDLIMDGIEASFDVFGSLVKSGFLRQGNCTSIVTKDFHWTRCTRYCTLIGYELLHPDSFICCFRCSYVLRFTHRSRNDALFGTARTYSSTIQYKYVSGLRLRVIRIGVKVCIDVTIYDKLFVTSINEKHILSPFRVFQDVLDRCLVLHSGITLVPLCYTYRKAHIRSGTQHCIHDRTYG